MRFNQLKRDPNSIIRKKLYRKGKCWVISSSLAFASGLILLGTSGMLVQADATSDNTTQEDNVVVQGNSIQDGSTTSSNDANGSESVGSGQSSSDNGAVTKSLNGGIEQTTQNPTNKVQPENIQVTKNPVADNDNVSQDKQTKVTKFASLNEEGAPTKDSTETGAGTAPKDIVPNYNPDAVFADNTNNSPMSGTQFTIADNQIPNQIKQEGIYQSGMDGTSPYFITNDTHTLYLLDGTLDKVYTEELLTNDDLMLNHIFKVDTSLAKKVYFPTDSSNFFSGITYASTMGNTHVLEMDLSKADTSNVTDMSYMFNNASVQALDLSSFDTSNVTNMSYMFENLNTMSVPNSNDIEAPCVLDVSSFNGNGLTGSDVVDGMFEDTNVTTINMPHFTINSDGVENAYYMFNGVVTDKVSIPNFDGSKIKNWDYIFSGANINNLDISNWNMTGNSKYSEFFSEANIKEVVLGPKDKFVWDESIPTVGTDVTDDSKWISIEKNGLVDNPETALMFSAYPQVQNDGLSKYYDGTGKTGVRAFVPDIDIAKLNLNVPTMIDGKKTADTVYPDLYVKIGIPVTVDVPVKTGYTSDKKTIVATVTKDGITTDETINYKKIPTSSGTTQNIFVSNNVQTVVTYPDKGNVTLYKQEGQEFVPITDRVVEADSGWYTDQVANVGSEKSDIQYYRIATNEWVKASQAYVYKANKIIIRTTPGAAKQLIHAEGTNVTDRALSSDTEWYSDLTAVLGDSEYYRVATNEFVNKADVTVIKDI
ncbi:BspA family leucine-rich repeat surface protein [Companilactobacillus heilongjiangensis]|uniref:BspA family leucine-rich repeat surface protein n=1 Tax=Companilactobacillus heilongjiangensis TaxID=1074467 RepID=UPI0006615467|nr:BspA family leucine-rich repeat surface protein [Companilactobacillus heilongjiangensis]